ncbi:phosphoglycolate phosphatase [Litorimonas sp.]|uniref:phosphoglycolate phosphatase n=1 Tax=Litorimonas sp. TaxID=1892381 RepID=UPI003A840BE2
MRDLWTKEGAIAVKAQIESYWLKRGFEVEVKVVASEFTSILRKARFDVRSNLVNGLPKELRRAG